MRNDALDILIANINNLEIELIEMLSNNNIDEKIILSVIELFIKKFGINPYN
jgi:hypothetical protein